MSMVALIAAAVLMLIIVPTVQALMAEEARSWLPYLARAVARAAARRLPVEHGDRYEEEWLAELAAYSDRPLTSLVRALGLWFGASATAAALVGDTTWRV